MVSLIEGLDDLLESSGQAGLTELRNLLQELLGGPEATGRLIGHQKLAPCVYRLRFKVNGRVLSLVVKRLDLGIAQRNQLVTKRWLPAIGLSQSVPPLLGVAAERSGQHVWHIYEDFGAWMLDERAPDPARVGVAVELIAQIHTRFAGHALLAECRLWGGDLGIHFYASSVRDAIRSLESLRPPYVELSAERLAVRDRLLESLHKLLDEEPDRARVMRESGGPETLLHGDLWPKNTLVFPTNNGLQARLIDWDRAGVGPVCYDLSTFLGRFPTCERQWILDLYQQAIGRLGWRLPSASDLNLLFDTAERARLANCVIWRALAIWESQAEWAFHELAFLEQWFEMLQPVFPMVDD
jgi:Phosphotransferase enzyme family